jgi:hypothetical protein
MAYSKEGNVFTPVIDGGSEKYWQEQREGFKRITKYREALALAEKEKTHSRYEQTDQILEAVTAHPGAVRILGAWRLRVRRRYWDSYPVLLNKNGCYAQTRDIPVFGTGKKLKEPGR